MHTNMHTCGHTCAHAHIYMYTYMYMSHKKTQMCAYKRVLTHTWHKYHAQPHTSHSKMNHAHKDWHTLSVSFMTHMSQNMLRQAHLSSAGFNSTALDNWSGERCSLSLSLSEPNPETARSSLDMMA